MQEIPIVLSGGGARGFAHAGVLQALEESGIKPSAIAATSAGALVGAFIADGFHPVEIKELVLKNLSITYLIDFKNFRSGLISLNNIAELMRKNLRHKKIEKLPLPFFPAATNLLDGSQHFFKKGDLVDAVIAASSIPSIFNPVKIDGIPYGDGGIVNNLPTEPFSDRIAEVIAVHVNPCPPFDEKSSIAKTLDRSLHLCMAATVRKAAAGCSRFIEPPELQEFGMFDAHKLSEIYTVGYEYTVNLLK